MMDPNDAPTMRSHARLGLVLREKWRIERLIGVGGMASVYAATHVNNGKRVAIKVLHAELSGVPEVRSRFLREGYVANKVMHPAIVSILDDDVAEDGSVFLVMELLEGETVEALRERSGNFLPVGQVVQIIDQLLDVLAAAHDAGVIHRDIKPENLFLTRDGSLKVLDFGIARLRELQGAKITMTGAGTMGTPAFMAQEQARGRSELITPRTDLWAAGATMFTLVSGRLVHDAETVNELLLSAMTRPAPPILSVMPMFPPPLAGVIDRALAYEQSARWPDARAMQAALRQAAAESGMPIQERLSFSGSARLSSLGLSGAINGPARPVSARPPGAAAPLPGAAAPHAGGAVPSLGMADITPAPISALPMSSPGPGAPPAPVIAPVQASTAPGIALPAESLGAQVKQAPPMLATAPAVTMGPGRSAPLSPKWLIAAAGLLLALGGAAVWVALRRSPGPPPAEAGPTGTSLAAVTPSAPEPAMTVAPGPSAAPSTPSTPTAAPLPPVEPEVASAAPSVPSPSTRPTAQPAPKGTGSTAKVPAPQGSSGPKKKNERDLLNRRN